MAILEIQGLSVRFGGLAAVDKVTASVEEDSVCAVIGPNGAGKTTLFNLITGVVAPSEGRILFKGRDITFAPIHNISRLGIARTFQNIRLFRSLTVRDNVAVAMAGSHPPSVFSLLTSYSKPARRLREYEEASEALLEELGCNQFAYRYPAELSYGDQRRVEIARALASKPSLLLLDEPAAGMNQTESESLARHVHDIRSKFGVTVLLIDHNLRFVEALADKVIVLNFGMKIAEGTVPQVRNHPDVIAAYLGTEEDNAGSG